jgi:hypothetical protein
VSSLALLLHAFWIYEKTARLWVPVKLVVTVAVLGVVAAIGWRPVLGEYRREHPPPTFAFVVPGVVLYGPQNTGWDFLITRRGLDTLYNVQVFFRDMDVVNSWKGRQSLTDADIQRSQLLLNYPEIDPDYGLGFAKQFQSVPFNLEHSHFTVRVSFRGGRVDEDLRIEKTDRGWQYQMTIRDIEKNQVLIDCRDPFFPKEAQGAPALPKCFPDVTNY